MKNPLHIVNNEKGSLLVIAVVILMLLTLIGISITTTTSIELQIAGNDKLQKKAFYTADGATHVASELLEQNLGCMAGFTDSGGGIIDISGNNPDPADSTDLATVRVTNLSFWENTNLVDPDPSDTNRDLFFPATAAADASIPHTNLLMGGNTALSQGSAIQMSAGYEGKGKGVGAGGAYILYNMFSQHLGQVNSESVIQTSWRHVIGQEGACNY